MSHVHEMLVRVFVAGQTHANRRLASDRGATLVEYVLMIALVVLVALGALTYFGQETSELMEVPPNAFGSSS